MAGEPSSEAPEDTVKPEKIAEELVARTSSISEAKIRAVQPMTGDASSRRYFRVELSGVERKSAVLMILAHGVGPLVAGQQSNQDDTYVELTNFLRTNDILTPELLCDGRDSGALLIEDVGDRALWQFAFSKPRNDRETVSAYSKAIDLMQIIHKTAPDPNCIAFKRWMGKEQYQAEAHRFIEFFLPQYHLSSAEIAVVSDLISSLSKRLDSQVKVLSHRDFMSWNLHIDHGGNVRVLDFQDSLLAAPGYDLISLLADRDTAQALGKDLVQELMRYALAGSGESDTVFREHFYTALLQRHLRLCGQFLVLSEKKQNPIYKSWVPGMLYWVGRGLHALPEYDPAAKLLTGLIPEVKAGFNDPW